MTKTIDEVGSFKIKRRKRVQSSRPYGLRAGWTEYQVWDGRKIVSRHDTFGQAREAASTLLNEFWDEQARQLKAIEEAALKQSPFATSN